MLIGALAVGIAGLLEVGVAEPPRRAHPVAWFGRVVAPLDRSWEHPRLVGLAGAAVLPLAAAIAVAGAVVLAANAHLRLGAVAAGLALFATTSLRMLLGEARAVVEASEVDLDLARRDLRALAGRDADALSAGEVRSAAVESAAENLADGLVGPLLFFVVGIAAAAATGLPTAVALAAGAGGAAWVKAVNTMDSMLGYRSKPVGWAPARLDDAVQWMPARVAALLLAAAAARPRSLADARAWLEAVPSPNSGWPMGTLAAAAGCRLTKPGAYDLNPDARLPDAETARGAVRTVALAGALSYLLATGVVAWL